MKWLFLFIVLINAAFLSWHSFTQDKPQVSKEPVYGPPVSEKIYLLSEEAPVTGLEPEKTVARQESFEAVMDKVATQVEGSAESAFCPLIEVERQAEKEQIQKALDDRAWPYETNETSGKRTKFWLYVAAPETQAKAREIVKDLASKSIDSFVINREEMKNRISLGLYSSAERANQAKSRIEEVSGYTVNIYEHMRNVSLQQIKVGQAVDEKDWVLFVSQFDLTQMTIKVEKNPC
ncbi:SPOR domain-containing protein [Marinomonas sp. 2405UD66-6]|uniref:SPOR domain-containing protein n=1 Tax=Marinomonas sp. 2405UD66-6 TaxID=3391834 RepID=UPI0039C8C23E